MADIQPGNIDSRKEAGLNHDLDYFVNVVKDYSVWGIVPRNTKIGALTVNPIGENGFATYGTDAVMFWDAFRGGKDNLTHKFFELMRGAQTDSRPDYSGLTRETNYISILETTKDPKASRYKIYPDDTVIFAYGFIYNDKGQDRGTSNAVAGALMSRKDAEELVEKIKKDPNLMEGFYQRVFSGLDSKVDAHTGMVRYKAKGFVVVGADDLSMVPEVGNYGQDMFPDSLVRNLPSYNYSKPVGVQQFVNSNLSS